MILQTASEKEMYNAKKLWNYGENLYILLISFICDCSVQRNHLTNVMVELVIVPSFLDFFLGCLAVITDSNCFAIFTGSRWVGRWFFKPRLQFVFSDVFKQLQSHIIRSLCKVHF